MVFEGVNSEGMVTCFYNRAAGLGFEPRLPGSEPGCLPLADPAIMVLILSSFEPGNKKTFVVN